ncbi:uncharacterized protein FIBRA_08110 [Fibroporia radiculosa]|uniref:Uncharacterized protein n=1 Tax=Fibroporia radiculosa TaxID=599839 RepID=J4GGH2_9APHY|nr:uncharacterized protein FIBRA_08110 [Fibroporia radiculosa]CCM05873.1 predicted protein [Fibroporia radiculosa]
MDLAGVCSTIFLDGPFEVIPQFHASWDSVEAFAIFKLKTHPVLFIGVKSPSSFRLNSQRKEADRRIRGHFRDLHPDVIIPTVPAISAFGTLLSFYRYDKTSNSLTPAIEADLPIMTDTAPKDRWDCDILDATGTTRFREMANEVKTMCTQLLGGAANILGDLCIVLADLDLRSLKRPEK